MTKRAAEEAPSSLDSSRNGPNYVGYYRDQVAELLSREERIPHQEIGATKKSSAEIIGSEISSLKNEKLNALLRQCVQDLIPEVEEVEDDLQILRRTDPGLFEEIERKHTNDVLASLDNMKQQLEKLLDNVATKCRPMSRGEKRDLQKSIKELPGENLKRIAGIIKDHYVASGKEFRDEVTVNLEEEDNILLWRLHFYVGAVKNARKLAS
ncbi:hypothetical protein EUTSA_v10027933mg [Eutrema salsugineum]|uniref:NET domain-containing protein n=1 Tax=Eutrema salsugineum TaxID=72664 RepID=V4M3S9_EUTSA|nr:hypothetical protein EUTSA_v10027933mg [Eutrema salsugineum]